MIWTTAMGCRCSVCRAARARIRRDRPYAIARTYFARIERMARAGLL